MEYRLVEPAGVISFDNYEIPVYDDLDTPLFRIQDIARAIRYPVTGANHLLKACEKWEHLLCKVCIAGQIRTCNFVTEKGLYNILAQSRSLIARKWRQVIFDQLISMRKKNGNNIEQQFKEYAEANESNMDDEWFDEETGKWMYACTTPGGEVEIFEKDMHF